MKKTETKRLCYEKLTPLDILMDDCSEDDYINGTGEMKRTETETKRLCYEMLTYLDTLMDDCSEDDYINVVCSLFPIERIPGTESNEKKKFDAFKACLENIKNRYLNVVSEDDMALILVNHDEFSDCKLAIDTSKLTNVKPEIKTLDKEIMDDIEAGRDVHRGYMEEERISEGIKSDFHIGFYAALDKLALSSLMSLMEGKMADAFSKVFAVKKSNKPYEEDVALDAVKRYLEHVKQVFSPRLGLTWIASTILDNFILSDCLQVSHPKKPVLTQ